MLKIKHSIDLVTEINENNMPADLLNVFINLSEVEQQTLLAQTFIAGLNKLDVFNKLNDGFAYATVKVAE
jgi:hypothetical protein